MNLNHIKQEKAEFYTIFLGYVASYFGKSISGFTDSVYISQHQSRNFQFNK